MHKVNISLTLLTANKGAGKCTTSNCKRTKEVLDKCAWAQGCLSQQLFTVLFVYHKIRYSPSALGVIDPDYEMASELSRHNGSLFEMSETARIRNCLLNIGFCQKRMALTGQASNRIRPCVCMFLHNTKHVAADNRQVLVLYSKQG